MIFQSLLKDLQGGLKISIPSREELRRFVSANKWIIFAVLVFLVWKIFLTYTLWEGRTQPPEWDDSYGYIEHIYSVASCSSLVFCQDTLYPLTAYAGFDHLTYRLFWGGLARLLSVDAMTMFHWSFYFGIPMLFAALLFFLRRLTANKNLIALSLFMLALYNGAGSYHGFFWVVPSFFAVVFFFVIAGLLLDQEKNWRRWAPWIVLVIPLAIFTHIISLYAILLLFPAFTLLVSLFHRKLDILLIRKVVFTMLVALAFYLPVYFSVSRNVPYGPQAVAQDIGVKRATVPLGEAPLPQIFTRVVYKDIRVIDLLPASGRFYRDYVQWVFRNWVATALFIGVVLLVLAKKEYTVLSLYLASLGFSLISTLNQFGYRSLAILWPVTFLLCAYGAWAAFQWTPVSLRKSWGILGKALVAAAIAGFVIFNVAYSLYWNETRNRAKNFHVPDQAISFIYSQSPETIALDSLLPIYLRFKRYQTVQQPKSLSEADYFCGVVLENISTPLSKPAALFQRIFTSIVPSSVATNEEKGLAGLPEQFVAADTFENVVCYRNTARI